MLFVGALGDWTDLLPLSSTLNTPAFVCSHIAAKFSEQNRTENANIGPSFRKLNCNFESFRNVTEWRRDGYFLTA